MERELTVMIVWVLFGSTVVQAIVHLMTWQTLRRQAAETVVGKALDRREMSLGIKAIVRAVFDLLLATAVTWGTLILNRGQRETLYLVLALVALVAVWYGVRFVLTLRRERFGRPDP